MNIHIRTLFRATVGFYETLVRVKNESKYVRTNESSLYRRFAIPRIYCNNGDANCHCMKNAWIRSCILFPYTVFVCLYMEIICTVKYGTVFRCFPFFCVFDSEKSLKHYLWLKYLYTVLCRRRLYDESNNNIIVMLTVMMVYLITWTVFLVNCGHYYQKRLIKINTNTFLLHSYRVISSSR